MSSGLMKTDTMVSGEGLVPWHGVGTVVPGLLSSAEALSLSGLDWNVNLTPVRYEYVTPDGVHVLTVPDRFVVVRETDQAPLGVVGTSYVPVQNVAAFNFMDSLTDSGDALYTSAGSLWDGKRVFLTAKLTKDFTVAGEDAMDTYLLISNSHDGSKAFTAAVVTVRVVCQNTLTFALSGAKTKWSVTHRSTLEGRMQEARDALELSFSYQDAFAAEVEQLLAVDVTKDRFLELVKDVLPDQKRQTEKNLDELAAVWSSEPTNPEDPTGWKAVNAFAWWTDHGRTYRDSDARFKTLMEGGFAAKARTELKDRILALA